MAIPALSLGVLVAIHKLEYLLDAQIVGRRIRTRAFELLGNMLLLEAMFGLAGLAMAPIIYAHAKAELLLPRKTECIADEIFGAGDAMLA